MGNCDADVGSVQGHYDWSTTAPSIAVINAVAVLENVEPSELAEESDTTLYDHINPDALDTLVAQNRDLTISFTLGDYQIRVRNDKIVIS